MVLGNIHKIERQNLYKKTKNEIKPEKQEYRVDIMFSGVIIKLQLVRHVKTAPKQVSRKK